MNKNIIFGEITGVVKKTQGDQKYLFGTIGSDKIKNVTFVPVLESSDTTYLNEIEDGYQRPGSRSRMNAFARFLKDNPNSIVPPVLLSGRGKWEFEPTGKEQSLGRLIIHGPAAIVDGQHRLGGFVSLYESQKDVRDISFILLPNLTPEQEENEFVVVNSSQKGVPRALIAYLGDTEEAQVAWGLNEEPDSPFKGRITRTTLQGKRTKLFALHSVARQVKQLFSSSKFQYLDVSQKIEYMSRLWTIIADQLPEEWSDIEKLDNLETKGRRDFEYKLLELTGLVAWAHTGTQIFARSYSEEIGMNWNNVTRLVEAASGIDWRKNGEYKGRTGETAGKDMASEMTYMLPAEVTTELPEDVTHTLEQVLR